MRGELGDGYAETLRSVYSEVPDTADYVMYWWHRAAEQVRAGRTSRFGFITIRGSSSRGGAEGLRSLTRALRKGHSVVVVPDGPRGPREVLKPGVVRLARLTGAHVVPAAFGASSEWRARSWDEFRIPKPFSRCVMRFGEPVLVPRDIDGAGEETARKEIEAALNAVTGQVDEEARR